MSTVGTHAAPPRGARRLDPVAAEGGAIFRETSATSALTLWAYLAFVGVEFLNLGVRVSLIGALRPTILLVGLLMILLVVQGSVRQYKDSSPTTRLMWLLVAYVVVTLPFVEYPGSVIRQNLLDWVKVAVFFFFTIQIVDTVPRLKLFVAVVVGCQLFRVVEPLYLHIAWGYWGGGSHGGGEFLNRLAGSPADFINPNGLAFVIITVVPFLHYLLLGSRSWLAKLAYCALMPTLLYALILTGSRSGLIGLAVILAAAFVKSQKKGLFALAIVVGLSVAIPQLSNDQADRFASLFSDDSAHAATREGRLTGMWRDFTVGFNRPAFGHGLGTGQEAKWNVIGGQRVPHNLYAEAFIELGGLGLVLFLTLLWSLVQNTVTGYREVRKLSPDTDFGQDYLLGLANAIQVWVVMALVFSMAQYGVSEFHWYLVGGLSVVLFRLADARGRWFESTGAGSALKGRESADKRAGAAPPRAGAGAAPASARLRAR
jgi:hypothetical protein